MKDLQHQRQSVGSNGSKSTMNEMHDSQEQVVNTLREQVAGLNDEKNALLDYIEENIAEPQVVESMKAQIDALMKQNEMMRLNYRSPNFAGESTIDIEKPYEDTIDKQPEELLNDSRLPESIHDHAEDTFGNAE